MADGGGRVQALFISLQLCHEDINIGERRTRIPCLSVLRFVASTATVKRCLFILSCGGSGGGWRRLRSSCVAPAVLRL